MPVVREMTILQLRAAVLKQTPLHDKHDGGGVRVAIPTHDAYDSYHHTDNAVQKVEIYKNVPPSEYINASHVDPRRPPLNAMFRNCGSLPSFRYTDLVSARRLAQEGMHAQARSLLLLSQPPPWPYTDSFYKTQVCQQWYNLVDDTPSTGALTHTTWMALLTHHRRDTYDTVLNKLPCVICGDAESYDGNVIVFCDALWYCRGGVAYHQDCIQPTLTSTADTWHCDTCRRPRETQADTLMSSPMDALVRKRQIFANCWRQRSGPDVDRPSPRVFQPSEYMGGQVFSAARFLVEPARPSPCGEQSYPQFAQLSMQTVDDECEEARDAGRRLDGLTRLFRRSHGSHRALAEFRVTLMKQYPYAELPFPQHGLQQPGHAVVVVGSPGARSTSTSVMAGRKWCIKRQQV